MPRIKDEWVSLANQPRSDRFPRGRTAEKKDDGWLMNKKWFPSKIETYLYKVGKPMQTLNEIQAKIAELQQQEKLVRAQEYSQALAKAQELINTYSIASSFHVSTTTESP